MKSLYWHDYETWGATPGIDKPSQFAGIRTDEELNIIDEPLICYCKPSSDCLPHPQACLITGITPQKALSEGKTEPHFFDLIHQQLLQAGTCGVGYNSIRFDDEVTRYGLYRNFYDPYEREWKHGNSRWDIIDMVRLTYALKPETLQWVTKEDGSPSFKLEHLSVANGIEHSAAHDALSDVYATIALAKLIKQRQPKLYQYAYELRLKSKVSTLIDIDKRKPLLHISSRFSAASGCAALVAPLMMHPKNKNSVIAYDLSADPEPLIQLSSDQISERVYSKQEDLPEGVERIPLKEIHLNKSPMLATPKLLNDAAAQRLGIDKSMCEHHWNMLCHTDFREKLTNMYESQVFPIKTDPEQQLYDCFISDHDRQLFPAIRGATPESLFSFELQLKDKRLRSLLFRYRARHYPEVLTQEERLRWQEWCYQRITETDCGGSITLEQYFAELNELSADPNSNKMLIQALLEYGDQLLNNEDVVLEP